MKRSIDTYVQSIAHDNREFIHATIADYIIDSAESNGNWWEFFDEDELCETGEPTDAQIEELKSYLRNNYNYNDIDTLEELADLINDVEYYPTDAVDSAIERNGWHTDDDDTHICNDGDNVLLFNDNGEAVVRQYFG